MAFKIVYNTLEILWEIQQLLVGGFEAFINGNNAKLAASLRSRIYKTSCYLDRNVVIENKHHFKAECGSAIYHSSYILNKNGTFSLGTNSHLGAYCYVNVLYGNISIGSDVAIGPGTKLIAYSNHYKYMQKVTNEKLINDIKIGNNILIGANCVILPGAIIHDHVIVGAGSVIKGVLDTNSIYAGVPCKKIKSRWYK